MSQVNEGKYKGFFPELGASIAVIPRYGEAKDVIWLPIKPCYVFHFANAYEENGKIQLFGCRYGRFNVEMPIEPAYLHRWTIDLKNKEVDDKRLMWVRPTDFPVIHPDKVGQKNRYIFLDFLILANSIGAGKFDLETGRYHGYNFGLTKRGGGDTCFVANPDGTKEDDGWLMNFVHDTRSKEDELIILPADKPGEGPVARVKIPTRVPFGFHSTFLHGIELA